MVRHHLRLREEGWPLSAVINGTGAVATFVVTIIVAVTKFTRCAWVPIVVVPLIILLFKSIGRHYRSVTTSLVIEPADVPPPPARHTFVVLVGRVHRGVVEAICEDYRAGATIDRAHDDADRGERRIACPLLVLWSAAGALPRLYGDVLDVWRPWASELTGRGLDASHFLVEDRPEDVAGDLIAFLPALNPTR